MGHELHVRLFIALNLFGWGLALGLGGWAERIVTAIMLAGAAASIVVVSPLATHFTHVETGMTIVDGAMLIAFFHVAHRMKKAWLIWMTGLQLLIVLSHFPILLRPIITPEGYIMINGLWPWLMMFLLIGATIRSVWQRKRRGIGIFSPDS